MNICLAGARAEASRVNGARAWWGEGPQPLPGPGPKSRGPRTPEGKARSAQNALRHGLRAQKFVVVGDEKAAEFAALEAALRDQLAPEGTLQGLLAGRIARAAWRLERAERIEAELFARAMHSPLGGGDLGLALIRDGSGARAFDTLLRYRGTALAELWRALRLFKALQAEPAPEVRAAEPAAALPAPEQPIEPEARGNPSETAPVSALEEVDAASMKRAEAPAARTPAAAGPARHAPVPPHPTHAGVACSAAVREEPIEPEARENPGEITLLPAAGRPDVPARHQVGGARTAGQTGWLLANSR